MSSPTALQKLLAQISQCEVCASNLPCKPRPVLQITSTARMLIIGQAPGLKAHEKRRVFDDPSGDRLRRWLAVNRETFYNSGLIAVMPMGFCYPGKQGSGDMGPRPECAPLWHDRLLALMPSLELIILAGAYAHKGYLPGPFVGVTQAVADWRTAPQPWFPLIHPSPRNQAWVKKHPWFEQELVPDLQQRTARILRA